MELYGKKLLIPNKYVRSADGPVEKYEDVIYCDIVIVPTTVQRIVYVCIIIFILMIPIMSIGLRLYR